MAETAPLIDKRQAAIDIVSDMLSPEIAEAMANSEQAPQFGAYIGGLALDNVFPCLERDAI